MQPFAFSSTPLEQERLRGELADSGAGGYVSFEGWVRDHNEGRTVQRLEYEAFEALALKEGERIVNEAVARFGVTHAACLHRLGSLDIGELAVWVGVSAGHAGSACGDEAAELLMADSETANGVAEIVSKLAD